MKTLNRICIRDYEISAANGDTLILKRGKEYITSVERDGLVTVFSSFWVKVPADLFAGEAVFTDATPDTVTITAEEHAALRGVVEAAGRLESFAWTAVTPDCEESRVYLQSLIDSLRAALGSLERAASPPASAPPSGRG